MTVLFNSYILVFVLLLLTLQSSLALANTKLNCSLYYDSLSNELSQVLSRSAVNQKTDFKSLHNIENNLFDSFEQCSNDARFYTLMGETQIAMGNIQLAYLYAKKSMQLDGDYWQTYHLLGNTLCMLERCSEGIGYLEKAVKLAPTKPELEFNLCNSYIVAKMHKQAIETCTRVLKRKDHQLHGAVYYLRGLANRSLDKQAKAKQDFKNARILGYEHSEQ